MMYEIVRVSPKKMAREASKLGRRINVAPSHPVHEAGGTAVKATESWVRASRSGRPEQRRAWASRPPSSSSALFKAKIQNHTNQLDATAKLRGLRREIARINTDADAAR